VEIFKIESTLRQSLDFVRQQLTSKTEDPLNYSCPDDQCRGFG
jgi:hypothetical protein